MAEDVHAFRVLKSQLSVVIASEAKQSRSRARPLDCRVASLLAMMAGDRRAAPQTTKLSPIAPVQTRVFAPCIALMNSEASGAISGNVP
jgi:hypothetical protein